MTIETERLVLRPFVEADAEDVFEYLKEPGAHCFLDMKLSSVDEAREAMKKREKDPGHCFAIVLKESGKVIGEVFGEPEGHWPDDKESDTFSPCLMLNGAYHGKGYAYEVAKAYFDYIFNEIGIRRIYVYTDDYNVASQALCKKLGMRQEGLFLEFVSFVNEPDGSPHYENTYQFAILKREWQHS